MSIVNTNISALVAQKALGLNNRVMSDAMAQLSTGKRLNSAADDAAGTAISAKLATQVQSLNMAVRNTNDGISMMQTADGAAGGIQDMLYRMKELAVQSINDTNSSTDRVALDSEFQQLEAQIRNSVANTTWNGINLLDGSLGNNSGIATYHVGATASDGVAVTYADFDLAAQPLTTARAVNTGANADTALTSIEGAINQISTARATWGAAMNRLVHAGDNAMQVSQNLGESYSRIMDTDYAQATADLARSMILDQAGSAMLTQANQQPYYVLTLLS
ncbi:flagellin [Limnohabitans sp. Rim47]|uniref:flagellin N-terminal helical domain-containing protein n=1 Tax=Limnohabitans sp. Rim47 TaxID=1100721 RepID=UPI000310932D|nr:flagellin [Limnohabitans sp. Rim47]